MEKGRLVPRAPGEEGQTSGQDMETVFCRLLQRVCVGCTWLAVQVMEKKVLVVQSVAYRMAELEAPGSLVWSPVWSAWSHVRAGVCECPGTCRPEDWDDNVTCPGHGPSLFHCLKRVHTLMNELNQSANQPVISRRILSHTGSQA